MYSYSDNPFAVCLIAHIPCPSTSSNIWRLCCPGDSESNFSGHLYIRCTQYIHNIDLEHCYVRWKTCYVDNGACNVFNIECSFRDNCSIGLHSTYCMPTSHIGVRISFQIIRMTFKLRRYGPESIGGLTYINLRAGDVEWSAVKSSTLGQSGYSVF